MDRTTPALDERVLGFAPRLTPRAVRWLARLPIGLRRKAADAWVRRHPLPAEVERDVVAEVERDWDGVPLPTDLGSIIDRSRSLLIEQAGGAHAAACDGPAAVGRHLEISALGPLEQLLDDKGAAMVLTPTFGAWQTVAPALARRGYRVGLLDLRPAGRAPAARFPAAPGLDLQVLPVAGSARPLVRFASEERSVIVALADEGRGVRFGHGTLLDRSASVGSTPFELARRVGLGVLPAFVVHGTGPVPRLVVERPLRVSDTGRGDADLDTTVARWLKLVDKFARRYPDHYLPTLYVRWCARRTDPLPLFADSAAAGSAA